MYILWEHSEMPGICDWRKRNEGPDEKKFKVVKALGPLRNLRELRGFLGLTNYLRHFIPNFSTHARPLNNLLKKDVGWKWEKNEENAYTHLKTALTEEPVYLHLPKEDEPFILDTDASTECIAAVLQQGAARTTRNVIAYASRTLTEAEKIWPIRELEAYAIVWGILYFNEYLQGKRFTVRTDHESLRWLWKTDKRRIAR